MNIITFGLHSIGPWWQAFESMREKLPSLPFANRFCKNWRATLMDASATLAAGAFAITFFTKNSWISTTFLLLAIICKVSAREMHQMTWMRELKEQNDVTLQKIQEENKHLGDRAKELGEHNNVLKKEISSLCLQNGRLQESTRYIKKQAEKIKGQNIDFGDNLKTFDACLQRLDEETSAAKELCDQVKLYMEDQEAGLAQQLETLRQYLAELRAEDGILTKIQELRILKKEIRESGDTLRSINLQYASQNAKLEALCNSLSLIKEQFEAKIQTAAKEFGANNHQLAEITRELASTLHDLKPPPVPPTITTGHPLPPSSPPNTLPGNVLAF